MSVVQTINEQGNSSPSATASARRDPAHHLRHHQQLAAQPWPPHRTPSTLEPQQRKFDEEPPMFIDTNKRYVATMVTSTARCHRLDPCPHRSGQQLRLPGPLPYYDGVVPPHHPGFVLQAATRRGAARWAGVPLRRRIARARPLQAGVAAMANAGRTQRQPVLRHQRDDGSPAALYSHFGEVVSGST